MFYELGRASWVTGSERYKSADTWSEYALSLFDTPDSNRRVLDAGSDHIALLGDGIAIALSFPLVGGDQKSASSSMPLSASEAVLC